MYVHLFSWYKTYLQVKILLDTLYRNCGTWVISRDSFEIKNKKFACTFKILGGSNSLYKIFVQTHSGTFVPLLYWQIKGGADRAVARARVWEGAQSLRGPNSKLYIRIEELVAYCLSGEAITRITIVNWVWIVKPVMIRLINF